MQYSLIRHRSPRLGENNKYGMGTSQARAMSISSISKKGEGYGIANEFVDGMDVMAVREATLRAIERGRHDGSPTLLLRLLHRASSHSIELSILLCSIGSAGVTTQQQRAERTHQCECAYAYPT